MTKKRKEKTMKSKVTVEEWVKRFRAVGLDDAAMQKWHTLFEKENPNGHQSFLEWLGLPSEKIAEIRQR
jgi:transposase